MINIAELLSDLDFVQTITITEFAGAYNPDGVWERVDTSYSAVGSMQQVNQNDLTDLDIQGYGNASFMKFYTTTIIQEGTSEDNAAHFEWNGIDYKIIASTRYQDYGYNMYIGRNDGI